MINLYQPIASRQRRLIVLTGLVVILCAWSLYLPPTPHTSLELPNLPASYKPPVAYSLQELKPLELSAWNLPEIAAKKEVVVIKPVKVPVKKIQPQVVREVSPAPNPISSPPPVYSPPLPVLPKFTYLGQLVDQTGLQLFFNMGESNVMMRPNKIYDNTWQIYSVTNDEIQIQHIPSQQIIRVNKNS